MESLKLIVDLSRIRATIIRISNYLHVFSFGVAKLSPEKQMYWQFSTNLKAVSNKR